MPMPPELANEVLPRLRRAEGQLRGVQRLIEEGAECDAILTQMSAAAAAVQRAQARLLVSGLRYCVTNPDAAQANGFEQDRLEKLIIRNS